MGKQLAFIERQQPWGPGRVDTFNPYKAIQFGFPMGPEELSPMALDGASDYPSLWMQAPREGMNLHWDGNNSSVAERNLSAALGAGVTPVTVTGSRSPGSKPGCGSCGRLLRPGPIDRISAQRGRGLSRTIARPAMAWAAQRATTTAPTAIRRWGR